MENLVAGDLIIDVSEPDPAVVRLDWKGKSNDRHPGKVLAPFFEAVSRHAQTRQAAIEMHFESLEYFSSSTITALIQFIQAARASRSRLVIVFDDRLKWQKLSFDALRIFENRDGLLEFRTAQ